MIIQIFSAFKYLAVKGLKKQKLMLGFSNVNIGCRMPLSQLYQLLVTLGLFAISQEGAF